MSSSLRKRKGVYLIHCIARQFQALVYLRLYRSKTDGRVKDESGRLGYNRNLPKSVVSIYDNDDKTKVQQLFFRWLHYSLNGCII